MSEQQLEEFKELLWEFGNERYSQGQDDANRASNKTRLLSESYQELIELYDTALTYLGVVTGIDTGLGVKSNQHGIKRRKRYE